MTELKKELLVDFETLRNYKDEYPKEPKINGASPSVYYFLKMGSEFFDIVIKTHSKKDEVKDWLKQYKLSDYVNRIEEC